MNDSLSNLNNVKNSKPEVGHKLIMIYGIDSLAITPMTRGLSPQIYATALKMNKYAKKNSLNVTVDISGYSKIDVNGKDVDVILLPPELYTVEEEIKNKFPDKVIKLIEKRDFGLTDAENIFKTIFS